MRSQIVRVTLAAVGVALLLFAVPLALSVRSVVFAEKRGVLQRAALEAAGRVGRDFLTGDPIELPAPPTTDTDVAVYDVVGRLRAGQGPAAEDPTTVTAAGGRPADGLARREMVVAVPIFSAEDVIGVVRASAPTAQVWRQVGLSWLGLLGLAGFALAGASVVATRQARRLSRPLEALSGTALRVSAGDLGVRVGRSQIAEIDRVGQAQNAMVERLTARLQRERQFSADVSHQLRTPLTRLQLGLQTAIDRAEQDCAPSEQTALTEALQQVDVLDHTIGTILDLAREGPELGVAAPLLPAQRLAREIENRWHGPAAEEGRNLVVRVAPDAVETLLPAGVVAQSVDALVENALRHGRGAVSVLVRELADTAMIDVVDEGSIGTDPQAIFARGISTSAGPGIGLAFARSLAEAAGGRLVVAATDPTRFSLLLPSRHSAPGPVTNDAGEEPTHPANA